MQFSPKKLEDVFNTIYLGQMDGMPVVNKQLSVKAVNFEKWENYYFGVLITPWFMNLMLFDTSEELNCSKVGSINHHVFPSGGYDFVVGYEEGIGYYQSCSLFSPMFEFDGQEAAEATAAEALKAVMDEENIDEGTQNPVAEIEQIWSGEKPKPSVTHNFDGSEIVVPEVNEQKTPRKKLSERLKESTTRRDFLRGKAFRPELYEDEGMNSSDSH